MFDILTLQSRLETLAQEAGITAAFVATSDTIVGSLSMETPVVKAATFLSDTRDFMSYELPAPGTGNKASFPVIFRPIALAAAA